MSTTFGNLKTRLATVLQDPSSKTFTEAMREELIQSALVEVGRIAPEQFTEDLALVDNQISYTLRDDDFSAAVPEIEVARVEVWNLGELMPAFVHIIPPAATEVSRGGDAGWSVWGGILTIPTRFARGLIDYNATHVLRVWGYSPYVAPDSDDDVIAVSQEVEQAMIWYCRLEAIEMLLASRDLFTQWQIRSGNTDISPAGLMNQKNIADGQWQKRSRAITRLRSEV